MPLTDCCEGNNRGVCRQAQKQVSDNLQKIDVDFTLCKRSPGISRETAFNNKVPQNKELSFSRKVQCRRKQAVFVLFQIQCIKSFKYLKLMNFLFHFPSQ